MTSSAPRRGVLTAMVDNVEHQLADYYGFTPQSRASSHLVSQTQLHESLGDQVDKLPEVQGRAGVFVSAQNSSDEIFIGIHFAEQIKAQLEEHDPLQRLDDENLDGFCVLVEEVSHFHLILNRANLARGVSKLELEWQGEIDKLLVSALLLQNQYGDAYILPLARRLFDGAQIIAADADLYWQATRHAARFWFGALRRDLRLGPELRDMLRRNYDAPLETKLRAS